MSVLGEILGRGSVTYHIAIAEALDSVAAAIFAEQVAWWQMRSEDGWVFRSVEQIREYSGLKKDAQLGARKKLKQAGLLEEEHRGMPARNYYRLDMAALAQLIMASGADGGNPPTDGGNPPASKRKPANRSIERGESEEQRSSEENADAFTADYYVAQLAEDLEDATIPLLPKRKAQYGKEFKQLLKRGIPDPVLNKVIDRIIERWQDENSHYKLTAEQALGDVNNGKSTGRSSANRVPPRVKPEDRAKDLDPETKAILEQMERDRQKEAENG